MSKCCYTFMYRPWGSHWLSLHMISFFYRLRLVRVVNYINGKNVLQVYKLLYSCSVIESTSVTSIPF